MSSLITCGLVCLFVFIVGVSRSWSEMAVEPERDLLGALGSIVAVVMLDKVDWMDVKTSGFEDVGT